MTWEEDRWPSAAAAVAVAVAAAAAASCHGRAKTSGGSPANKHAKGQWRIKPPCRTSRRHAAAVASAHQAKASLDARIKLSAQKQQTTILTCMWGGGWSGRWCGYGACEYCGACGIIDDGGYDDEDIGGHPADGGSAPCPPETHNAHKNQYEFFVQVLLGLQPFQLIGQKIESPVTHTYDDTNRN